MTTPYLAGTLNLARKERQPRPVVTKPVRLAGWTLAAVLLVSGCHTTSAPSLPTTGATPAADAPALLNSLPIIDRPAPDPSYRRDAFGRPWADTDRDGCSQRVNALSRAVDRTKPFTEERRRSCDADVVAGTWIDPYTGQPMTFTNVKDQQQAQQIPVDHIVALTAAWRYGAQSWSEERRLQFATDLDNLQPTSRAVNSAKSDNDAAAWRPKKPFQCAYAGRYIAVKVEYRLPVDRSERAALREMLATCSGGPR